ncbi:MAG TPA: peptidylprolyl isomerase [Verrucomicrobiae bacterium]|nr:peptidylprolyl isomerase [Verrucomicrobiae bacterium]
MLFAERSFADYTNGIYAEFNTSMGSFTCRLDYAVAPKAVANFIGLATGERAWLDTNGFIRTSPFYSDSIFHRVVPDFVVQCGSINGLPKGGPGYQFRDEFSPSERHDAFGVLSMANSGPDSNGSQFFVTAGPQPALNDSYTIFGRLYGGSNVVYSMNHVSTLNEKPLTNIVLQNVVIRRIGESAQAFDIHAQGLPVVTNLYLGAARSGTNISLTFSNQLNVNNWIYSSTNLHNWSGTDFGFETTLPLATGIFSSAGLPAQFFRGAQIRYPQTLYVPRSITGRKLTLNLPGAAFDISFTNATGGSYTNTLGKSGVLTFYTWKQDPYRGRLSFGLNDDTQTAMELHLDYTSASAGNVSGLVYYFIFPVGPVTGTFSSIP